MEDTEAKLDYYDELPQIPRAKRGKCWMVRKALIITLLTISIGLIFYSSRKSFNCAELMLLKNRQSQLKVEPVASPIKTNCSNLTIQVDECRLRKEIPSKPTQFKFVTSNNYSVIARVAGYIQYHLDPYELNQTSLVAKYMPIELETVEQAYLSERRRRVDFQLKCGNMSVEFNKHYRYSSEYSSDIRVEISMSHPLHSELCEFNVADKYSQSIVGDTYRLGNEYYQLLSNSKWCKQQPDSVPELGEVTCYDVTSYKCLKASKYNVDKNYTFATLVLDALEFEINPNINKAVTGRFTN